MEAVWIILTIGVLCALGCPRARIAFQNVIGVEVIEGIKLIAGVVWGVFLWVFVALPLMIIQWVFIISLYIVVIGLAIRMIF